VVLDVSEATDAAAIKTAINAQFTTPRAVELDEAAAMTGDHILIFVSRRYDAGKMLDGSARTTAGRVITRYIGKRADNLQVLRERTKAAIEEKFLPGGVGPFAFENEAETLQMDLTDGAGWYTAADSWTY
jgi:hypothetical protein